MTRAALLLAGLVLMVAFAGCAGGDGDDGTALSASGSSSGAPTGSGSGSTRTSASTHSHASSSGAPGGSGGAANVAPSAVLEASTPTGAAPLEVRFTINGTDPDGDALSWGLDVNGDGTLDSNGTSVPAQVNHTFEAGTYVVNLTVSDGSESAHASVNITVSADVAGGAAPVQVVDGEYVVGAEGCMAAGYDVAETDGGAAAGGTTNEVTRIQFDVDPLSLGRTYTAVFSFDQGYLYVAVDFYDGGDALVSGQNTGQAPNFGGLTMTGVVPAGAVKAVLFACGGPTSASVHYEA